MREQATPVLLHQECTINSSTSVQTDKADRTAFIEKNESSPSGGVIQAMCFAFTYICVRPHDKLDVISFNGGANAMMSRVELLCFSSISGPKPFDTLEAAEDSSQGARLLQMHIIHQGSFILSWYSNSVIRIIKKRATPRVDTNTTHFGMSPTHCRSFFTCIS